MQQLDNDRLPQHVAIIMDGNGRWAKARGMARTAGHVQGTEVAHNIIEEAVRTGIKYLTLYTFSTENWNRPSDEVAKLMELLFDNIEEETFMRNNVRFVLVGDMSRLPERVAARVRQCMERTGGNTGMTACLAVSYSARWELTESARSIAAQVAAGSMAVADITEDTVGTNLATTQYGIPDVDLLVRTGGEQRISNYLLWQCAYAELYFTPIYWPDFTGDDLRAAIYDYQQRERRFGKTSEQI